MNHPVSTRQLLTVEQLNPVQVTGEMTADTLDVTIIVINSSKFLYKLESF